MQEDEINQYNQRRKRNTEYIRKSKLKLLRNSEMASQLLQQPQGIYASSNFSQQLTINWI